MKRLFNEYCIMKRSYCRFLEPARAGVTVVELLVSIGVISLLMAILLPAVQQARETARNAQCKNNLHQVGLAAHSFDEQNGYFDTYKPLYSLLPMVDQRVAWEAFEAAKAARVPGSTSPTVAVPPSPAVYLCPSDPYVSGANFDISYLCNNGSTLKQSGIVNYEDDFSRRRLRDVTDGLSTTAFFAERKVALSYSSTPQESRRSPYRAFWYVLREFLPGEELQLAEHCLDSTVRAQAVGEGLYYLQILFPSAERPYNHIVPQGQRQLTIFTSKDL